MAGGGRYSHKGDGSGRKNLVKRDPAESKELWKRQLATLRILERMDEKLVASMAPDLASHPDRTIRECSLPGREKPNGQS